MSRGSRRRRAIRRWEEAGALRLRPDSGALMRADGYQTHWRQTRGGKVRGRTLDGKRVTLTAAAFQARYMD